MRRLVLTPFVLTLCAAVPAVVHAQTTAAPATAQTPVAAQPVAQTPAAAATAPDEPSHSLFEPSWHQFMLGGRFTSVSGDPARFQRYQDVRDGLLFTGGRYALEQPQGDWSLHALADNVGWRDQHYFANYDRPGRFVVSGTWDQIPQFYSVDTKTPFLTGGGNLVLDDATQRAIQNGQANTSAYIPIAPQFDLEERRDIGQFNFKSTPTPQIDVTAAFTTQRHRGELPWGASFGFSNDVEVALPYDSRANDFTLGTEWTNGQNLLRIGYEGTWFNNLDDTLVWDSPLRLDDASGAPGKGRMALWPSNSAQTVSVSGYTKLAHKTQISAFLSYGIWSNDEPLQPFTINTALPVIALPRTNTQGEAGVGSVNLNLVSHPTKDWRFSARMREYDYNNKTPDTTINQYVSYDSSVNISSTLGPERYAHNRFTFDSDATWTVAPPVAVTFGYTRNNSAYDFRIFQDSGENVFRISADAVTSPRVTFRTQYEYGDRTGSGLNEELLTEIGEQPGIRHYDLADRTRNRFSAQADFVATDRLTFSASAGIVKDEFSNSTYGLQETTARTASFGGDFQQPNGFGGGATYNYERYAGLQRSHEGDSSAAQFSDPLRDWTADSAETVHYFSIYASPPRIGRNTEVRVSYDYSHAEGSYLQLVPAGSPITAPNQLPNVFNKLQQFHLDVRHRVSSRVAANFSSLYEPFRVFDFAFDPSVVDSIVQPSSLVMGYVYRPYTAHSAVLGLRIYW